MIHIIVLQYPNKATTTYSLLIEQKKDRFCAKLDK
jgi:hypothetical protein